MKKEKILCISLFLLVLLILGLLVFNLDISMESIECNYEIKEDVTLVSEFVMVKDKNEEEKSISVVSFKVDNILYGVGHGSGFNEKTKYLAYKIAPAFVRTTDIKLGFVLDNQIYSTYEYIGKVIKDNDNGCIFSSEGLNEDNYTKISVADKIVSGDAKLIMRNNIGELQTYSVLVQIIKNKGRERLDVTITDEELIDKTNGILLGMSGTPIIQDGKLIGVIKATYIDEEYKGIGKIIWDIDCIKNANS